MDPDDLVQCPYDPNHQIRKSRLPYHLRLCKKNNPVAKKTKKKVKTCPFNSLHVIASIEFEHHKIICPDRGMVHSSIVQDSVKPSRHEMPIINHNINCSENWDAEDEVACGAMFVLNGPESMQQSVNLSAHSENNRQALVTLRQPRMEPLAQHLESDGQRSQATSSTDRVSVKQSISGPSFIGSGFGRGTSLQSNEAASSSQKQQAAGTGIKVATSSVGFNLDTLTGRPLVPQVNETSWPNLSQPGQYPANQHPTVPPSNKLNSKGSENCGPGGLKTTGQGSVSAAELKSTDTYSARVQPQNATNRQTPVSCEPAKSQPHPKMPSSAKAQPQDIVSSTSVSLKPAKCQKPQNVDTENKNNVKKDAVTADVMEQARLNAAKEDKKLKKKLKAIQQLEAEMAAGKKLDKDQLLKLTGKEEILQKLAQLNLS